MVIDVRGVTYRYARSETAALDALSLHVQDGSLFGLLGPNGSGKTTLISILAGLLPVPSGTVSIGGYDLNDGRAPLRETIALVPQDYAFYPTLTVNENLRFFAAMHGLRQRERDFRVNDARSIGGLDGSGDRRASTLSGGMKRRLNLAIGLLNRPRLLLLDEPTVGIDPQSRAFILQAITRINQQGATVVYTTHYMEEVESICDAVGVLDSGRLLASGSLEVFLAEGRGRRLRVDLGAPLSPTQARTLAGIDGLVAGPRSLTIEDCTADEHCRIVALLRSEGVVVAGVQYGHGTLEERFLALTHPALRDS